MADEHADRRVRAAERSHRRTALGLPLVVLPGIGGLIWFATDQYVADTAKFAAYRSWQRAPGSSGAW